MPRSRHTGFTGNLGISSGIWDLPVQLRDVEAGHAEEDVGEEYQGSSKSPTHASGLEMKCLQRVSGGYDRQNTDSG